MLTGRVTTCMFWRALSVNLRLDGGRKGGNRETEIMSLLQVRKHGGLDLSACGRSEEPEMVGSSIPPTMPLQVPVCHL